MLDAARCVVVRDLLVAWRRRSDVATALLFFVIVASLFPLGVGAEPNLLRAAPLGVIAAAKAFAHWLVSGLPLALIAPLIALQYDLPSSLYGMLALSLLLGTPVLSLLGAIGAALTLGLRGGGVLLSLLVLPLYVPVLIMGAGSLEMAAAGMGGQGQLLLHGAMLVVAAAFAPWAISAALRI